MAFNIQTPKSIILPSLSTITDENTKRFLEKLISQLDIMHRRYYADLRAIQGILSGEDPMQNSLDMGSNKIVNVSDPTDNQDASTKKYHDDH